jgi:superfamily I DNA and/or RNA helicase
VPLLRQEDSCFGVKTAHLGQDIGAQTTVLLVDVAFSGTETDDKWQAAEDKRVQHCINQLKASGVDLNLVFIISLFRQGSDGLHRLLGQSWKDRIGTVYTFQGRENEAVILVLGASGPDHKAARAWVGNQPNIINVAVSRAKRNLYVIGDFEQWQNVGVVQALAKKVLRPRSV